MTSLRWVRSWLALLPRGCTRAAAAATAPACTRLQRVAAGRTVFIPHVRPFVVSTGRWRDWEPPRTGTGTGSEEEEEEEDFIDDSEAEELFQQQQLPVAAGHHRVIIVHPDVKWGSKKQHLTTGGKADLATRTRLCIKWRDPIRVLKMSTS